MPLYSSGEALTCKLSSLRKHHAIWSVCLQIFTDGRWLEAQLPGSMPSKLVDHDQQ